MTCARCANWIPRLTVDQTRCVPCQRDVDRRIAEDAERRGRVVYRAKLMTPFSGRPTL